MELRKTTILPPGNAAACAELRHLMLDRPEVLFVILGEAGRDEVVEKAGLYAGGPADLRWVVWAKSAGDVRDVISGLRGSSELPGLVSAGQVVAFTLSYSDVVADVIREGDTIDNARVVHAYLRAEAKT